MKVKLTHICYDTQNIELPEQCPECDQPVSEENTRRYYYVESRVDGTVPRPTPEPVHSDLLLMVQCADEDCNHILAHASPAQTELFHSLELIGVEIENFLNPRVMTERG